MVWHNIMIERLMLHIHADVIVLLLVFDIMSA
jgi:hypothetical protein